MAVVMAAAPVWGESGAEVVGIRAAGGVVGGALGGAGAGAAAVGLAGGVVGGFGGVEGETGLSVQPNPGVQMYGSHS